MLNQTHSVTGAVTGMAAVPVLPGVVHPHGLSVLAFVLAAAGAATLPDLDHPESSPSNFLPPVTPLLAILVSMVSGGHRKAAHWLWSAIPAGLLAVLPAILGVRWVLVPVAGFLAALALWASRLAKRDDAVLGGLAVAGLAVWMDPSSCWWLGVATTIGYVTHIAGDLVYGGCWIGPGRFAQVAELDTGGVTEVGLARPLSWLALGVVSAAFLIGWGPTMHYLEAGAHGAWLALHPGFWSSGSAGGA